MAMLGVLISGPETALGGVITQDVVLKDQQHPGSVPTAGDLVAAASFTNGIGSLGPIVQGIGAGWVLQCRWGTIFVLLGVMLLVASCALGLAQFSNSKLISRLSTRNTQENRYKKDQ